MATDNNQKKWYLTQNSKKYGPFTDKEMDALFQNGKVSKNSYVWMQGYKDWVPILKSVFAAEFDETPPIPGSHTGSSRNYDRHNNGGSESYLFVSCVASNNQAFVNILPNGQIDLKHSKKFSAPISGRDGQRAKTSILQSGTSAKHEEGIVSVPSGSRTSSSSTDTKACHDCEQEEVPILLAALPSAQREVRLEDEWARRHSRRGTVGGIVRRRGRTSP